MAAAVTVDETSSEVFDLKKCNLSVSECLHCVVLEEKLRLALEEIESTKVIIELLKSDNEKYPPLYDREENPPSDMFALLEKIRALRETVDSFPVGAARCVENSLENEIKKTVDKITLANARLLMLKAQDEQRKLPQDRNPLDLLELFKAFNRCEDEMATADLRKQAWKNSIEACFIRKIMADAVSADQGTHSDSLRTIVNLLDMVVTLNSQLKGVWKEQQDIAQEIIATKQELQQWQDNYKALLAEQKRDSQERAVTQDHENIQANKKLEQKLEKVNLMRFLMVHLLSASHVDYMQHPEWTKVLVEMQGFLSMESFMPSNTETQ